MNGLENETYLYMLITSVVIASIILFTAVKWPRVARWLFFILFASASIVNFYTSQNAPQGYLEYANLALSEWYVIFIEGWFSRHIKLFVGMVAACQALIAVSMLFKGTLFELGAWGSIIFFLAIIPLGVGSGFPTTLITAIAMFVLLRSQKGMT